MQDLLMSHIQNYVAALKCITVSLFTSKRPDFAAIFGDFRPQKPFLNDLEFIFLRKSKCCNPVIPFISPLSYNKMLQLWISAFK